MIVAVFASLLLASVAQDPSTNPDIAPAAGASEQQAGDIYSEEPANGAADNGALDPYQPVEQPAQPVDAEAMPTEQAQAETEEDVPMVCRRTTVYTEFGRQRSRRVCRPRDEW